MFKCSTEMRVCVCVCVCVCDHCCRGKAISIAYFERVFVALGIQHAMHMPNIVICGMSGCIIFFHIIS